MKLKERITERETKQKDLAENVGYSEFDMSRVVNGYVLPTPEKMTAICRELECGVLDIYEKREIDLLPKEEKRVRVRNSRGYNLCVFIPEAYRYDLPAAISAAGHKTFYDWLKPYIEQTIKEYKNKGGKN